MKKHPKLRAWRNRLTAVMLALSAGFCAPVRPADAQGLSFIRDTEIEELLNDYAQPIFRAAGLGSGRITIRIIRHEAYNAFVLDGRNIFIHTGTLQASDTPNQVIGVIASTIHISEPMPTSLDPAAFEAFANAVAQSVGEQVVNHCVIKFVHAAIELSYPKGGV